jgi:hypothetical protein
VGRHACAAGRMACGQPRAGTCLAGREGLYQPEHCGTLWAVLEAVLGTLSLCLPVCIPVCLPANCCPTLTASVCPASPAQLLVLLRQSYGLLPVCATVPRRMETSEPDAPIGGFPAHAIKGEVPWDPIAGFARVLHNQ